MHRVKSLYFVRSNGDILNRGDAFEPDEEERRAMENPRMARLLEFVAATPEPQPKPAPEERPLMSRLKSELVEAAAELGVETAGLTKAQLADAIEGKRDADG